MGSQPGVSDAGLHAAVELARCRNGDDTLSEAQLAARLHVAGPEEVVRGAALMAGALGNAILDRRSVGDVDAIDIVAAGLRRLQRSDAVGPEALPLAAGLLTAALVTRIDTLAWLDKLGPRPSYLAPSVEVLAAFIELVDMAHAQPGLGAEIISSVLD